MPSKSQQQQKFFGLVDAYQKGETDNVSPEVKKAADTMTRKEVRKFAKTKHKGLPERVDEKITSILREEIANTLNEAEVSDNLNSFLKKENERPIQQYHGTWIYAIMNFGNFDSTYKHVLFHTTKDYNNMEAVNKSFPPFSGQKHIKYIDFIFNIDDLKIVEIDKIWIVKLGQWTIIPENIAKTLSSEMKKWNEDTIKRDKIKEMFCTTLESVGRKVPNTLPRK